MTKKIALILSLIAAAGFSACRSGPAPVQTVDAVEIALEPAAEALDSSAPEDEVESIQPDMVADEEAVEAKEPAEEAETAEKGKKKKEKSKADGGKCKHVQCFDLCCDEGQVCAHTHGGGDGAFPPSYKCLTPPK